VNKDEEHHGFLFAHQKTQC